MERGGWGAWPALLWRKESVGTQQRWGKHDQKWRRTHSGRDEGASVANRVRRLLCQDYTDRPDYPDSGQLGRTKAGLLLWPLGEDLLMSIPKATPWLERLYYWTFRGNDPGGEYSPSQYKDSVPWFQAAQDEDRETFKANQDFRRNSQVVFALPMFRNIRGHSPSSAARRCPLTPPPISFFNKTSLAH
jgi:hypothetical protein